MIILIILHYYFNKVTDIFKELIRYISHGKWTLSQAEGPWAVEYRMTWWFYIILVEQGWKHQGGRKEESFDEWHKIYHSNIGDTVNAGLPAPEVGSNQSTENVLTLVEHVILMQGWKT